eukprot:3196697-Pyramimonas_sp.AAC.1
MPQPLPVGKQPQPKPEGLQVEPFRPDGKERAAKLAGAARAKFQGGPLAEASAGSSAAAPSSAEVKGYAL